MQISSVIPNIDFYLVSLYDTLKDTFINEGVVFFGGYAMSIYSRYMPKLKRNQINKIPDFDVLSEEPEETATIIKEQLISQNNISASDIKIKKHSAIGEIVAPHYEVIIQSKKRTLILGKKTLSLDGNPLCNNHDIHALPKKHICKSSVHVRFQT